MLVEIPTTTEKRIVTRIVGDYPLISGRYVPNVNINAPDNGGHTKTKTAELPEPDMPNQEKYEQSIYRTREGKYGFPAQAIKKAMVTAAKNLKKAKTKDIDGKKALMTFFIEGDEFIEIETNEPPEMRIGSAKNSKGNQVKTVNAQYNTWAMTFQLRYNDTLTSPDQIIMQLAEAGKSVGIGVLRPETQGRLFGTFHVESAECL